VCLVATSTYVNYSRKINHEACTFILNPVPTICWVEPARQVASSNLLTVPSVRWRIRCLEVQVDCLMHVHNHESKPCLKP
jgi:hypothetical protein